MKKVKLGFGFILVVALSMVAGAVIYATLFDTLDAPNMTHDDADRYFKTTSRGDVIGMLDATRTLDGTYCFPDGRFEIVARYIGVGAWIVNLGACSFKTYDSTGKGRFE